MADAAEIKEEEKKDGQGVKLQQDVSKVAKYGLLTELAGEWVNENGKAMGVNVISLPGPGSLPTEKAPSMVAVVFPYTETLKFTLNDGARNRGGLNEQFNGVVEYNQIVKDDKDKVQHIENGMYLFLDNISLNKGDKDKDKDNYNENKSDVDPYKPEFKYCRSGTVPHGNSLMLLGNEEKVIKGAPKFDVDKINDFVSPTMENAGGLLGYLDALQAATRINNPYQALENGIKGLNIVETRTLSLSTSNKGSRISDTPFITKYANVTDMEFTLWLETIKLDNGNPIKQLQYKQKIIIEFDLTKDGKQIVKWPHITVNTLRLKE